MASTKLPQDAVPTAAYENPISLKVMRLSKPKFHFGLPVPFVAPREEPAAGDSSSGGAQPLVEPAIGGMLALPHSFGDIYLGETFSCFVSLANKSALERTIAESLASTQPPLRGPCAATWR